MLNKQVWLLKTPPKITKRCNRCDIQLIHSTYNNKILIYQIGKNKSLCLSCALHTGRITENDLPKQKTAEPLTYDSGFN